MADGEGFPEYPIFWPNFLLRAEHSVDPRSDDYELQRSFTITIYVHNDEEKRREEAIFNDVVGILRTRARDYGLIIYEGGSGPYEGSRFQTLFGTSDDFVLGGTFRERLEKLTQDGAAALKHVGKTGYALLLVANIGIAVSGTEPDVAKMFNVPVAVIHMIVSANTVAGAAQGLKKLYVKETGERR